MIAFEQNMYTSDQNRNECQNLLKFIRTGFVDGL